MLMTASIHYIDPRLDEKNYTYVEFVGYVYTGPKVPTTLQEEDERTNRAFIFALIFWLLVFAGLSVTGNAPKIWGWVIAYVS